MYTIKTRIIILMALAIGLFVFLYIYQEAKGDLVLEVKDSEMASYFRNSLDQIDQQTGFMKQSARRLAAGGAALAEACRGKDANLAHGLVKRFVLESMRSLPEALGGGLWFEPDAFFYGRRWYGPYAYYEKGQLIYTEEYDRADYNYQTKEWYTAALPLDWDRNQSRGERAWWCAPYLDKVGSERYLITTSAVMYDRNGRAIGVTSTDWGVQGVADFISRQPVGKGVETFFVHIPSGRVMLASAEGSNALPILADWKGTHLAKKIPTPPPGGITSQGNIQLAGRSWHAWSGQSRDGFLLVRLVPEEYRLAAVREVNLLGRLVLIGIFVILFLAVWLGTRNFTRELVQLVASLDDITLERAAITALGSQSWHYQELQLIGQALVRMSERIQYLTEEHLSLERGLLQMQKMDALGRISSGVAHDFNNILQVMYSLIDILRLSRAGCQEDMPVIEQLESASRRAGALVSDILAYGRKHDYRREICQIDEVIDGVTPLLERVGGNKISLRRRKGQSLPKVLLDRVQIGQIFMNLFVNARDALPDGGVVTIGTSLVCLEGGVVRLKITFEDTGTGIPESIIDKIFDPFFTTKDEGKGTGLGLAMVHDLTEQNGGEVSVASYPGRGTIFTFLFPPADLQPDA
jgi:signal transduction histidine kinase